MRSKILYQNRNTKNNQSKDKEHTAVPHFTLVSVLIGVGVSAVTLLVLATFDGGLFGQEAESKGCRTSQAVNASKGRCFQS